MDLDDLKRVNNLWKRIYPYLASQILEDCGEDPRSVLELGPFSGGVARELGRLRPGIGITVGDESPAVVEYLKECLSVSGPCHNIQVEITGLDHLAFPDNQFDLVVVRGAFLFLKEKENLLSEVFRVLKEGGLGFVGGGFGRGTPGELIDEIAEESRRLNDRLGRKRISPEELAGVVKESKLSGNCRIVQEGGLWLYVRRPGRDTA
ncbi:MAG: class I SAM-dependent methyltransferase [Chloroflexi bacterium]|nr:class I SAM-dependent methyltransferase [Chloroflexota bacterium]